MTAPQPPGGGWQQQTGQGMPPGQAENGQAPPVRDGTCCGRECRGGPGKPFTPHYYLAHTKDGGGINLAESRQRLPASDLAAAVRVGQMHADDGHPVRCGQQTGRWLRWDGSVYAPQETTFGIDLAKRMAVDYLTALRNVGEAINMKALREAQAAGKGADEAKEMAEAEKKADWGLHRKYREHLWSERGQAALIRQLARTWAVDESQLDTGVGEIIVDSGRISYAQILADGEVKPLEHDPARLVTLRMGAGVDYDPAAKCPVFDQFLATSVADTAQRDWLLWRAANALFGRFPRKGLVNPIGEHDSGKSTFTALLRRLGGGYARTVDAKAFLAKHASDNGFLADELRGARLVVSHEPKPGARFDTGYLKALTGREDEQHTRGPYGRAFARWLPHCTVFLGSNHPVAFDTSDTAMLERLEPVRFARGYTDMDEGLAGRMEHELPGILNRLLGCVVREAQHGPPPLPGSMVAERERLAAATEPALRFVDEQIEEGWLRAAELGSVPVSACVPVNWLHQRYVTWAEDDEVLRAAEVEGRKKFSEVVGRRYRVMKSSVYRFTGLVAGPGSPHP
jgi:hypothetical protein